MLNALSQQIHADNVQAGWWRGPEGSDLSDPLHPYRPYVLATKLALIHSETSEALEGMRKNLRDDYLPHRTSVEVELADEMIRILDLAGALKLDLDGAMQEKRAYNARRADHKEEVRKAEGGKAI